MLSPTTTIKACGRIALLTSLGVSALSVSQKTARTIEANPSISSFGTSKAHELILDQGAHLLDPGPPRMLASLGCDGSTAMLIHAYAILQLHGVDPGNVESQKELLDPKRNPFIGTNNQDVVVAMKLLRDERKKEGKTLVFKSIFGRDHDATLDRRLVDLGTLAVFLTRRNVLDKLVCMVRDCFLDEWFRDDIKTEDTTYGYPVNDKGNLNHMCFARRDSEDANSTKAMLITSELVHNLDWLADQQDDAVKEMQQAGYWAPRVDYEDMLSFEEDKRKIPAAMEAWSTTLKAWGVKPSATKLEAYFRAQAGTRPAADPHHELIYNIEEVKAELQKAHKMNLYRP